MLITIIIILFILWLLGYMPLSIPDLTLFSINNHPISLWNILILAVILWAIGILPNPFRAIASVLFILWILSVLGILAITGLASIIVLVIIIGLIVSIFL